MTIHHDKLAYGRFAPLREDFSEERLEAAKLLSEDAAEKTDGTESEKDETDKTAKKNRA